jgi:signal transduction histidine kinase
MKRPSRTLVGVGLTLVTLAVPLGAWYQAGSASVRREIEQIDALTALKARRLASAHAERLGGRLEAIKDAEMRRPIYHYIPEYRDLRSDCTIIAPSPLTAPPADPLIRAYFQIDGQGRLTMPRLSHAQGGDRWDLSARWIRQDLALYEGLLAVLPDLVEPCEPIPPNQVSWSGLRAPPANENEPYVVFENERYVTRCPMVWKTVALGGEPALAAVRPVSNDRETVVQGFVVDVHELRRSLLGSYFPADCTASGPSCEQVAETDEAEVPPEAAELVSAALDLDGVSWFVAIDARRARVEARAQADQLWSSFRRNFSWVSLAALAAGVCLVGVVWQADRMARQRAQFAASAAHELRTPLAGMRVYAEMLAEGLGDPSRSNRYARHIVSESERLGRVVSNVLGYSRLERGALQVRPEPGDLADAVRDCVDRLQAATEAAGVEVEVLVSSNLPPVAFDRDAVFHIVQNLVDNAEKYTRDVVDRRIHVRVEPGPGGVALSVIDHGRGVPEHVQKALFRPFSRTDDKDAPPGLGLGLTLVQGLVRGHRGRVSYSPGPDGGAVFSVVFPA